MPEGASIAVIVGSMVVLFIWLSRWSLLKPPLADMTAAERAAVAEYQRRHHVRISKANLVILAITFAVLTPLTLAERPRQWLPGLLTASLSLTCVVVFAIFLRHSRRKRPLD